MEYILFIHNNSDKPTTQTQWDAFFDAANKSGFFNGGSEISSGVQIGDKPVVSTSNSVTGYMHFETDDVEQLYTLLELHPVKLQGGTLELCVTPKTSE